MADISRNRRGDFNWQSTGVLTDAMTTMGPLERGYETFRRTIPEHRGTFVGVEWRWFESGEGKHAVVLLPGAVGGADIFFAVFQRLAQQGRVLAVDMPFTPDGDRALDGLAALLDSRGIGHATLLGASFSGLFAQAFACRFPGRTSALILSHTGARDATRAARERRSASWAARLPLGMMRAVLKLVVRLLLRRAAEPQLWKRLYFAALDALTREDLVARYLLAASIEELRAGSWKGPVLIIHSNNDAVARPAEQQRLRAAYPDAMWHEFTGAGHSAYTMDPSAFAEVVAVWSTAAIR